MNLRNIYVVNLSRHRPQSITTLRLYSINFAPQVNQARNKSQVFIFIAACVVID